MISGALKIRREGDPSVNHATTSSRKARDQGGVHFSNEDGTGITFPHDEALVITLCIGGFDMEKILVDTGSSADILYYSAFNRMGLSERDQKPFRQPLVGFAGDTILQRGYITLQVTIGDESSPRTVTRAICFLVVHAPPAYNTLLGRPSMVAFELMIAPCYLLIRFSTPGGEGEIRENQEEAQLCYQAILRRHHIDIAPRETLQLSLDPRSDFQRPEPLEELMEIPLRPGIGLAV